jgi:flavodoxin
MGKSVIFLYSYHHNNTQKIGNAIAAKINASIIDINNNSEPIDLKTYDLVGFGAGIDTGKHYPKMIEYVEKLPNVQYKKAFIFSTSGIKKKKKMLNDHKALRNLLQNKGFEIVSEFGCKGHDTVSFLKYFGGINKDRPNAEDIKNAEAFAEKLLK